MKLLHRKVKKQTDRTPTPSTSAPVFSYHAKRLRPEDQLARTLQTSRSDPAEHKGSRLISACILTIILASMLYGLWLDSTPKVIIQANSQTAILQKTEVYEKAAQEILQASLVSKTKLSINSSDLSARMKDRFPELSEVEVRVPLAGHRVIFAIWPTQPALVLTSSESGAFIVNSSGRAMVSAATIPDLSALNVPLVYDESGIALSPGVDILTEQEVAFIQMVIFQLEAAGEPATELILPLVASELHVRLPKQPYFIKFNMQGEGRLQVGTFLAAQKRFKREGIVPSQYVDVRIPQKAFYK